MNAVRGVTKLLAPLCALAGTTTLAVVLASRSGIMLCGGHFAPLALGWEFAAAQQLCPVVLCLIGLCAIYAAWAAAVAGVDANVASLPQRLTRRTRSLAWVVAVVTATVVLAAGSTLFLSDSLRAVITAAILTIAVFTSAIVGALVANAVARLPITLGRQIVIALFRYVTSATPARQPCTVRSFRSASSHGDVCALALCQGLRAPPRLVR